MIPYVDAQLSIWGKRSVAMMSRGLGFSSVCPMFKQDRYCGGYGSATPIGVTVGAIENIVDTEAAVDRLKQEEKVLIVEYYVIGGKGIEVAARLGMAKQRMYERLHIVHNEVLGHLNDIAAGC